MFGFIRGRSKLELVSEIERLEKELFKFQEIISAFRGTIVTYSIESEYSPGLLPVLRIDLESYLYSQKLNTDPRGNWLPAGWLEINSKWTDVINKHYGNVEYTSEMDGTETYGRFTPNDLL